MLTYTALHLRHGGVERALTTQANALVRRGYPVRILCTYNFGEPAYPLDPRIEVVYLTGCLPNREAWLRAKAEGRYLALLGESVRAAWVLWRKGSTMRRALRSVREGVVISTRHEHSLLLARVGRPGVQKVAQLHHDHAFREDLLEGFAGPYGKLDDFVLLLPQLREEVQAFLASKPGAHPRVHSIGNAWPAEDLAVLEGLPDPERENRLLWVGRLEPEKDPLRAISAFAKMDWPEGELLLLGDGSLREACREAAEAAGVGDRVRFAGMVSGEEVLREMKKARALLLTSRTEGFGLVLLEALLAGLPAAAYDVRVAPRAMIADGKTGFVVPDGDEAAMTDRLRTLVSSFEMDEEARSHLLKRYSEEQIADDWEAVFSLGPKREEKKC